MVYRNTGKGTGPTYPTYAQHIRSFWRSPPWTLVNHLALLRKQTIVKVVTVAFEINLRKKLARIEHVLIVKVSFERRKMAKVFMTHVEDYFRK